MKGLWWPLHDPGTGVRLLDRSKRSRGNEELRRLCAPLRWPVYGAALFSLFANLLMLAGPVYMLQVYDRVLVSGSVPTLVALSLILLFLYLVMALLDAVRRRIMIRVALRLDRSLQRRVFEAEMRQAALGGSASSDGLEHLNHLGRFVAGPMGSTLFDLPWTPVFFAAIFLFDFRLGALALGGALTLVLFTLANQLLSARGDRRAAVSGAQAARLSTQFRSEAETIRGLGMADQGLAAWQALRQEEQAGSLSAAEVSAGFLSATRALRLALQSAMLGLGAWLVLAQQMTPGGMIAGSILLGRALSPIEALLSQWSGVKGGLAGWNGLADLLGRVPAERERTALPKPKANLRVSGLTVVPPGSRRPRLKDLTFDLKPGQALGVIGPSGSGKSTLARLLTGAWPATTGSVKLDGVPLEQYGAEMLGRSVGYLPQSIRLFDGTLAQNIAGLAQETEPSRIIAAAQAARAHGLITDLAGGYDTKVTPERTGLSGGEQQRIGLARALFGDPVLLVLDEPNANLDHEGTEALNQVIRDLKGRDRAIVVMAHRPAAIAECELLMVLEGGRCTAFGPKEEVLAGMVRNVSALRQRPEEVVAS